MENVYCCLTGKLFVSGQSARFYMRTPDDTFLPVHPTVSGRLFNLPSSESGVEFYSTPSPKLHCEKPQYRADPKALIAQYGSSSSLGLRNMFSEGFLYKKYVVSLPPGFGGEDDYDPQVLSLRLGYIEEQFKLLAQADQDSLLLRLQRMIGAGIDFENSQPADAERLKKIRAQQERERV